MAATQSTKELTPAGYVVVVLVTLSIFVPAGWLVTWRNPENGTHVLGPITFVLVFLIGIAVGLLSRAVLKLFGLTIWKDGGETNTSDSSGKLNDRKPGV